MLFRSGRIKWLRNIFIVWMATGLWHGAAWNFVLWGVIFAVLLMVEKLWLLPLLEKWKIVSHIYVLFFVIISFVIFDASSLSEAFSCITGMFGFQNLPLGTFEAVYYLKSYAVILIIAVLNATPLPSWLIAAASKTKYGNLVLSVAEPVVLMILLAVCTAFLIDGSFNPFLYFRF